MSFVESLGYTELAVALATVTIPAVAGGYYKYKIRKAEIAAAAAAAESEEDEDDEPSKHEREVLLANSGKDFISYLKLWNDIEKDIEELLRTSCLDRFMILRSWNGVRAPEYTSAIYQYKSEDKEYIDYSGVELDQDYKDRMAKMYYNPQSFSVAELEPCLIKNIYLNEGIKSSVWFFIISNDIDGVVEKSTTYCSFGSSHVDLIDDITIMRAQLLTSKIKGVMHRFKDGL